MGKYLVIGFLRGLVYGKRKDLKVIIMTPMLEIEKTALFFEKGDTALAFN